MRESKKATCYWMDIIKKAAAKKTPAFFTYYAVIVLGIIQLVCLSMFMDDRNHWRQSLKFNWFVLFSICASCSLAYHFLPAWNWLTDCGFWFFIVCHTFSQHTTSIRWDCFTEPNSICLPSPNVCVHICVWVHANLKRIRLLVRFSLLLRPLFI